METIASTPTVTRPPAHLPQRLAPLRALREPVPMVTLRASRGPT